MLHAALRRPRRIVWYCSPSYSLAHEQYRAFIGHPGACRLIAVGPGGRLQHRLQPHPHFTMINGSEVHFRSLDRPKNLRGPGVDDMFVDEAARVSETMIWETLRPMLSDRRGRLVLLSTFHGLNWFHDLHKKGLGSNALGARSFIYASPTGIVFQGAEGIRELALARAQVTEAIWNQEYLCLPSSKADQAFKFVAQCVAGLPAEFPPSGNRCLLGYDSGKTADPAAICVLDADAGAVLHSEGLGLGTPYQRQVERVAVIATRYGAPVIVDSTGAGTRDAIVDFIRDRLAQLCPGGAPPVYGVQIKGRIQAQLVNSLDLVMQQGRLSIPQDFRDLIRELTNYAFAYIENEGRPSILTYGPPAGGHDDHVNALMLANWARAKGWAHSRGQEAAQYLH